jgi:outer membrane receptor for ferrienterochelin and colicin
MKFIILALNSKICMDFRIGLVFFLFSLTTFAQDYDVRVKGVVIDSVNASPIPYVTVLLRNKDNNAVIDGATTDEQGKFTIMSNTTSFLVEVKFMQYNTKTITDFDQNNPIDLGEIKLSPLVKEIKGIEVRAEKSTLEFELDKRVFNIGKDISSTGMGALDVLNNVPSVNVDIDGSISLRNNAGVQILINGKPSVLADQGSGALGSITADQIDRIEVITNPSAKYEAEGSAGIINIILKRENKKGLNGSISINTGWPHNHSIGSSMNYRTEKFNFFTQFGAGYRSIPEYFNTENINNQDGSIVRSDGINFRNENFYNITLGADYLINDYNTLTFSGSFAYEIEDQPSMTRFVFTDSSNNTIAEWEREEVTSALNPKWEYDLQYAKEFRNNEEHKLIISGLGRYFGKDLSSDFTNRTISGTNPAVDQQTFTNFLQADYTFKLDYTNPITEKITLETGAQYVINDVGNDYAVLDFDMGEWVVDSNLTNNFQFIQQVLGIYSTVAYEGEKWGVKLGLRGENTVLNTLLVNTNERNDQLYTNLFPTLHTSYKISKRYSLQAGYSRRIYRPRLWDLNPFFNIRNNFNIRQGNPNLLPEFTDSYELTGIFIFDQFTLNSSFYHLFTSDVIERVAFFDGNVSITTPRNIGTSATTGAEINAKYKATKWLTILSDFNYGYFVRRGNFNEQDFDFSGDKYTFELKTNFKLKHGFEIELSGEFQSGFETVQGFRSGFAFMDAGIRKKINDGKFVLNLSVRDIFASRIREFTVDQMDNSFYSFEQRGRFITFGVSYGFGKGEAMTYSGRRR